MYYFDPRRLKSLILLFAITAAATTARSQTIEIGPNQYAFQFTSNPNYGLFFNSSDQDYQFLNGSAEPIFGFDANTGHMRTNLQFDAGSDFYVPQNRYAFRSAQSPNVGLWAGSSRIQFRNSSSEPIFSISAADGRFQSDIGFTGSATVRIAPDNYAFRSAANNDAGLYFGEAHFQFLGTDGTELMRINAFTGNAVFSEALAAGGGNAEQWTEAYSWGDHADEGYISEEVDPKIGEMLPNEVPFWNGNQLTGGSLRQFGQFTMVSGSPSTAIIPSNPYPGHLLVLENPGSDGFLPTPETSAAFSKSGAIRGSLTTDDDDFSVRAVNRLHLHAGSNTDPALVVRETDRVGIGTASPSDRFQVDAESGENILRARVDGSTKFRVHGNGGISVGSNYASTVPQNGMRINGRVGIGTNPSHKLSVDSDAGEGALRVRVDGATRLSVSANEGVNVGTSQDHAPARALYVHNKILVNRQDDVPGYRLAVQGSAIMQEVKVQLAGLWPDYVFGDDYTPMPLDELENFISENRHLPGVPDAATVARNEGIELGEMQRITMEKLEELTLYILEIKAQSDELKRENEALKATLDELLGEQPSKPEK